MPIGNRSRDLPVCSAVPQLLRHSVPLHPGRVKANYEVKRTRNEVTVVWFKTPLSHFPEGKEETPKYWPE
jgi:hypothetical protein